jgi:methionyl-tRNA formyltransferase
VNLPQGRDGAASAPQAELAGAGRPGDASSQPLLRLAFAGTPVFARVALERLHAACFTIPVVLTQPDRAAGRGMKLQASPVKQFAMEHGIAVLQPASLRLDGKAAAEAAAARDALQAAQVDAIVVAAYGLILPEWVLALPRLGCINIHASLLPRWRGAAPIHRAVEAGDRRTGITIMQMDAGLDTGAMLLVESLPIAPDDTTASLHDRLAALGGELVVDALGRAARGGLVATPQPTEGVSYAHKIDKAEAAIDWNDAAEVIERRIRAFDPFPGASASIGGDVVKVWRAGVGPEQGAPGEIVAVSDGAITVACGAGALHLTELQRAGGKRLPARAFLQGMPLHAGMRFAPRAD